MSTKQKEKTVKNVASKKGELIKDIISNFLQFTPSTWEYTYQTSTRKTDSAHTT